MLTPEQIQLIIGERLAEIEELFGIDAALWYKVGFMESIQVMLEISNQYKENQVDNINRVFSKNPISSGGIN